MRARPLVASALLAVLIAAPAPAGAKLSLQEVVLRTKPATVLVVAEVGAEVTLNCGAGTRTVAPPPFRETGTGWFIDGRGVIRARFDGARDWSGALPLDLAQSLLGKPSCSLEFSSGRPVGEHAGVCEYVGSAG